ncbi:MAG: glycosyltransferase [Candidatus Bathyarchaeota archaeon]|nr:glycosyltransferase [Candidatus Bathyarchaeota archaeon]
MVLVSAMMGSYNYGRYLDEAIQSVLNQTFKDLELIIIDDGSTDGSQKIIEKYQSADPRVKAVFHSKNMGIPRTINDAFTLARGKYVAFIGSDDVWAPAKLERQLAVMEKHPDAIVWSQAQIIDADGALTGQLVTDLLRTPKQKSGNLFQELLREDVVFGQSLLVKAETAKKFPFDETLRFVNDHLFFVQLAKQHPFIFIDEPLVKYRIHGQNATSKFHRLWFKERIMLRECLLSKYSSQISRRSKADIYYKIGHAYSGLHEKSSARRFYLKALAANPLRSEGALYLILALTNGEGAVGSRLESSYRDLASHFSQ